MFTIYTAAEALLKLANEGSLRRNPAGIETLHHEFFLALADHPAEWQATPRRPGINYIDPERYDRAALAAQVAAARAAGDLCVVSVHWGPNWAWRPAPAVRALGRALVELGADLVFGHSAHHVQGIEVYRGAPIIYGAGDFVDDYA